MDAMVRLGRALEKIKQDPVFNAKLKEIMVGPSSKKNQPRKSTSNIPSKELRSQQTHGLFSLQIKSNPPAMTQATPQVSTNKEVFTTTLALGQSFRCFPSIHRYKTRSKVKNMEKGYIEILD